MNTPPKQAISGNIVVTHFEKNGNFSIMVREQMHPNGYLSGQRQISIFPEKIAEGENPKGIADLLEQLVDEIRDLCTLKNDSKISWSEIEAINDESF